MALTLPWKQKNYLGQFASEATALIFIRAQEWDSSGDGTGNPTTGMLFYDTASAGLKVYNGSSWDLLSAGSGSSYWERSGTTLSPVNDNDIVQVGAGTSGTPGVASETYPTSGMYWAAGPEIDFSISSSKVVEISSQGIGTISGSTSSPAFYFTNDDNTGISNSSSDQIDFVCGGSSPFNLNSARFTAGVTGAPRIESTSGSAASPCYTFAGDGDTGLYRSAIDILSITCGGSERGSVDANGFHLATLGTTQGDITFVARTADPSAPVEGDLWFNTTDDVFRYYDGASTQTLSTGAATNYWERATTTLSPVNNGDIIQSGSGTAGAPAYAFETDTDSGIFSGGADVIGLSVSGSQIAQFSSVGMTLSEISSTNGDITFPARTADPSSPSEGNLWFNTTDNVIRYHDGSTTQTLATTGGTSYWEKVSTVLSPDTDGDIVQVGNGAVDAPGLASETYTTSGVYWAAGPLVNFSISGSKVAEISAQGIGCAVSGTVTTPSVYFDGDEDTGFSNPSANEITVACGGTETFTFSSQDFSGTGTGSVRLRRSPGTEGYPTYAFSDDTNTGMYRTAADSIGLTCGGTLTTTIDINGVHLSNLGSTRGDVTFTARTSNPSAPGEGDLWFHTTDNVFRYYDGASIQTLSTGGGTGTSYWERTGTILSPDYSGDTIQVGNGTAGAPGIASETYTDTGLYWSSGPYLRLSFSGTNRWNFTSSDFASTTSYGPYIRRNAGSYSSPTYSFYSDSNTGIYRNGSDVIAFSAGGTQTAQVRRESSGAIFDLQRLSRHYDDALIGDINFYGYNSVSSETNYGTIRGWCIDESSGTEDGGIIIRGMYGGSEANDFAVMGGVVVGDFNSVTVPPRGHLAVEDQIYTSDSTESAPAYSFIDDSDTGMYRDGTDSLGLAAGGIDIVIIGEDGISIQRPSKDGLTSDAVRLDLYRRNVPILPYTVSELTCIGKDSGGSDTEYTRITSKGSTVTAGNEHGRFEFGVAESGSLTAVASLDYNGLVLCNLYSVHGDIKFQNRSSDPVSPEEGELWYNSTSNRFRYDGGSTYTLAVESTVSGIYYFGGEATGNVEKMTITKGIVTAVTLYT